MDDFSDIPDEAVVDAAKDGYARWIGVEDWQALVRKIGTRDAAAAAQIIRPALAADLPVLNTARDAEAARVDELDRWLNAGDVAGYASVEDLLNAMRVRRNWLAQGVAAVGPREIREAVAAELDILAQELQQLANQRAEIDGDDFEECDDADQADCHTAASVATYVRAKNLLLRRAASLRGEQGE